MSDPAHSESEAAVKEDFTKTPLYAILDISIKVISSIAVVAIGIAGWRLQDADQQSKHLEEVQRVALAKRERAERRYLPMLRSLTEVDLLLAEAAADYTWPTHSTTETSQESKLGSHLAYFGASLTFPDGEPSFDMVTAKDNASAKQHPVMVSIPARPAVLLIAELMRLAPFFKRMEATSQNVRLSDGELVFETGQHEFVDNMALDARTLPAWNLWFPKEGMSLHDLFYEVDIDAMADGLHDQLRKVAEKAVQANSDVLSSEYVKIRDDVLKSRNDLVPATK
jgi:hypothetical protein